MNKRTPFEDFKNKEFKGDLLLRLIVCDLLMERGVRRLDVSRFAIPYLSNEHLSTVFDSLNLTYHPDDISQDGKSPDVIKRKGNVVEHYLWEHFESKGYNETLNFFRPFVAWPKSSTLSK